jgi:hypothetical protein
MSSSTIRSRADASGRWRRIGGGTNVNRPNAWPASALLGAERVRSDTPTCGAATGQRTTTSRSIGTWPPGGGEGRRVVPPAPASTSAARATATAARLYRPAGRTIMSSSSSAAARCSPGRRRRREAAASATAPALAEVARRHRGRKAPFPAAPSTQQRLVDFDLASSWAPRRQVAELLREQRSCGLVRAAPRCDLRRAPARSVRARGAAIDLAGDALRTELEREPRDRGVGRQRQLVGDVQGSAYGLANVCSSRTRARPPATRTTRRVARSGSSAAIGR